MTADPITLMILTGTFLLAGTVKGVIGLGLPTVSLALLAVAFDLTTAMALLLVPSLVTNLWQAFDGAYFNSLMRRLWPFFLCAVVTVWLGAIALNYWSLVWLTALLGVLLVIYAGLSLVGWRPAIRSSQEVWSGPVSGVVNGVLTGMTGSFVVPGVMYLQALGLQRDQLIQAMGILFSLSTLALAGALQTNRFISTELLVYSSGALLPALLGMLIGRGIRQSLSEIRFRRIFFYSILLLGAYIVVSATYAAIAE